MLEIAYCVLSRNNIAKLKVFINLKLLNMKDRENFKLRSEKNWVNET